MKNTFLTSIFKNETLSYFIIYTLSYFLLLINTSVYWDGWTLYNTPVKDLHQQFVMNGNVFFGYIYQFIFSYSGVTISRVGTFVAYFISALLLRDVLKDIKQLNGVNRFYIVALFLIFPLNIARITTINFAYCLTYLSFFIGLFVLNKSVKRKSFFFRILSYLFFGFSFFTSSFVFFFAIPIVLLAYYDNLKIKNIVKFGVKYLDLILLPIIYFFVIREIYFKPSGIYAMGNYNEITLVNILLSPIKFIESLFEALIKPFISNIYVVCFALGAIMVMFFTTNKKTNAETNTNTKLFLLSGLIICFVAAFPYLAVDKMGRAMGWGSRHQLLLPLGISIVVTIVWDLFKKTVQLKDIILQLIILSYIIINMHIYYTFLIDGIKQDALITEIQKNEAIKDASRIKFYDYTQSYDAMNRHYRSYEYNGMLKKAFKECNRLGVSSHSSYSEELLKKLKPHKFHKFYETDLNGKSINIGIYHGAKHINFSTFVLAQYLKLFNKKEYQKYIQDLIILNVI